MIFQETREEPESREAAATSMNINSIKGPAGMGIGLCNAQDEEVKDIAPQERVSVEQSTLT